MKEIQHALTVHGKFIKHLFSAEISLFFLNLLFFNVTVQVITWTYATSLYATLIQFTIVPNYLFFSA